ncbi:MAG: hypothetical protein E7576_00895 [Ruminococcaceae bacterium]|jgi:septum formation inhibitor-activating ATPase MinD|nr:hypothetical protein [Oscillospiraceae bacterium]
MPGYDRLLVASSKGGVGKSTAALGLAAEFARLGKRVLLCDLDFTSRSLDLLTGCEDSALFTFADLLDGVDPDKASATPFPELPGLRFLPAPSMKRVRELCAARGKEEGDLIREGLDLIAEEHLCDFLVCDTGGGLEQACEAASRFPFVLVASGQSQTSVRAAEYAASRLERCGAGTMRLCVCSFDLSSVKKEGRAGVIEMIDSSSLQCVGVIPFDPGLQRHQDKGELPARRSPVTAACRNIARRIMGYDVPLFEGIPSLYRRRKLAL